MIKVEQAAKFYGNQKVLDQIQFTVERGECLGIIGPNGSGKSTLLKLLSGVERVTRGRIWLDGVPVEKHSRKELAKWLAVLQQEGLPALGFTVREVVEMGRFPFQNWMGEEREDSGPLIDTILEKLGLTELGHRSLEHLSGGERQRVALGKTMAQQPKLLMLDEPTTYLDIGHQVALMDRIQEWQHESGMTVIAVMHDLNLASMYCDRLLMLHQGGIVGIGIPDEILLPELIDQVYGVFPKITRHPENGRPQLILPLSGPANGYRNAAINAQLKEGVYDERLASEHA